VAAEYLGLLGKRFWLLLPTAFAAIPAVIGNFGVWVGLPPWGWGLIALGLLCIAQVWVFHDVAVQRNAARTERDKALQAVVDAKPSGPSMFQANTGSSISVSGSSFIGAIQPPPAPHVLSIDPEAAARLAAKCEGLAIEVNAFLQQRAEAPLQEYMDLYRQTYQPRALGLRDRLAEVGLVVEHWSRFEYPTNSLGIEKVATALATAALRLRDQLGT
jgi:hypothetical protein